MRILHKLMVDITRHPREIVTLGIDFEWSAKSWTHNIFRVYELIFGRRAGIRIEGVSDSEGFVYSYSWENLFAVYESLVRSLFTLPKFSIVYLPQLQLAGLTRDNVTPFRFAIAFDTSALSTETNNTGQSWSHTCTGSNLILSAFDTAESTTTDPYTNMTYNSVAMTVGNSKASTNRFLKAWYLISPATGANTVQPTLSSQFNQGASSSFTGVKQSTIDNTASASGITGSSPTFTIVPNTAGNTCWVTNAFTDDNGSTFTLSGGTKRQQGSAPMALGDSAGTVSSAGVTLTWTVSPSGNWAGVIMSMAPVATVTVNAGFFFAVDK